MNAVVPFNAADLSAVVRHARSLLDEGDVAAAEILAASVYDQAKTAAAFGKKFGAAEQLIDKARRLQGDALLIESRAKIRLAEEWDFAQANGAALKGRPRRGTKPFTQKDAGVDAKRIHEARAIAAAERSQPGLVARLIDERVAAKLEPTRAFIRRSLKQPKPTSKTEPRFARTLSVGFDPRNTSYEALVSQCAKVRSYLSLIERIVQHSIPADRHAPLADTYSDADLLRFEDGAP
ncbi:MAG TPA: hypothetical protein VMF90_06065 [Rhizobiaceae bacterium]|nr:hypothetical protein [Rhizobiaceae bacterium]